jgi:hypothetical protein
MGILEDLPLKINNKDQVLIAIITLEVQLLVVELHQVYHRITIIKHF